MNTIGALAFVIATASAASICPDNRATEMDLCGRSLFMLGDRSLLGLPTTIDEMEIQCNSFSTSQRCISNYTSQCLEAMPKQVTGLLLKGAGAEVSKMCNGQPNRQGFITHTSCFNADWNSLNTCMESYIDVLQGVGNAKKDDKIPLTCCNYYRFHDCIINSLVSQGDATCTLANRNYMSAMLNGYASEVLGLLCGHTPPNSALCDVLVSPAKSAGVARTMSMLPPFINAFANF